MTIAVKDLKAGMRVVEYAYGAAIVSTIQADAERWIDADTREDGYRMTVKRSTTSRPSRARPTVLISTCTTLLIAKRPRMPDELILLREIADAAAELDCYEDFSGPVDCPHCRPEEPADLNAARLRVYEALTAYRAWATVHLRQETNE